MTTKRTSLYRVGRRRITEAVLDAFRASDEAEVARLLGLKPWEWPPLPPLDEACPWPAGTGGADWWPQGQELHWRLRAELRAELEEGRKG